MSSAVRWAIALMGLTGVSIRLAIDDTLKHHSNGCRTIHSVYWLFDHVLGKCCNAKCIVFAYLIVNEHIRFPVGWRVYRQGGPSKWKLALELIDEAISYDLKISVVLFDSWFCVKGFIKGLEKRRLRFIGDLKSSNTVEYRVQEAPKNTISLKICQLFNYGQHLCKEVWLGLKSNEKEQPIRVLYTTYSIVTYVAALGGKYLVVKSTDQRTGKFKFLITNELSWEASKVLEEYSYRWMIEEFFGNAKGLCGLEEACIRSEQGGALALFLVSFVDLLVSIQLWKSIHKCPAGKLPTVSAIIASATEENLRHLLALIQQPEKLEEWVSVWLQVLQKKKNEMRRERRSLATIGTKNDNPPPTCLSGDDISPSTDLSATKKELLL